MNRVATFLIGMCITCTILGLLSIISPHPSLQEKEVAVQEYIKHPENFKVQYLTDGKDTVEIRVHYIIK